MRNYGVIYRESKDYEKSIEGITGTLCEENTVIVTIFIRESISVFLCFQKNYKSFFTIVLTKINEAIPLLEEDGIKKYSPELIDGEIHIKSKNYIYSYNILEKTVDKYPLVKKMKSARK